MMGTFFLICLRILLWLPLGLLEPIVKVTPERGLSKNLPRVSCANWLPCWKEQPQGVEAVDLSCNNLGDKGCELIAAALAEDTAVKTFLMANNNFGDSGAERLAGALELARRDAQELMQEQDRQAELLAKADIENERLWETHRQLQLQLGVHVQAAALQGGHRLGAKGDGDREAGETIS